MLAHFYHPVVLLSYMIVVATSLFWFKTTPSVVVGTGMSVILLIVDYAVHCSIHNWRPLRFPVTSIVWVSAVTAAMLSGAILAGWQLAGIYLAQAVWDNSWHAASHHRNGENPRAELDYPAVRWGAATAAVCFVLIPRLI